MSSTSSINVDSAAAMRFAAQLNATIMALTAELREVKQICRSNADKLDKVQRAVTAAVRLICPDHLAAFEQIFSDSDSDSAYASRESSASRETAPESQDTSSPSSSAAEPLATETAPSSSQDTSSPSSSEAESLATETPPSSSFVPSPTETSSSPSNATTLAIIPRPSTNKAKTPMRVAPTTMNSDTTDPVAELSKKLRLWTLSDPAPTIDPLETSLCRQFRLLSITTSTANVPDNVVQSENATTNVASKVDDEMVDVSPNVEQRADSVMADSVRSETAPAGVVAKPDDQMTDVGTNVVQDQENAMEDISQAETAPLSIVVEMNDVVEARGDAVSSSLETDSTMLDVNKANATDSEVQSAFATEDSGVEADDEVKDFCPSKSLISSVDIKEDDNIDDFFNLPDGHRTTTVREMFVALYQLDETWKRQTGQASLLGDPARVAQEIEHSIAVEVDKPLPPLSGEFARIILDKTPELDRYNKAVSELMEKTAAKQTEGLKELAQKWCNKSGLMFEGAGPTMRMQRARSVAECKRKGPEYEHDILDHQPAYKSIRTR